jgi:hypothetical protein
MLVSVGEEILARTFTNLDFATCWSGEEPGVYVSIDMRKKSLREPTTDLVCSPCYHNGPGIYVSIGLRKESLRELLTSGRISLNL